MGKVERENWIICVHCERVFKSEFEANEITECPFGDCDGHLGDLIPWEIVKEANPEYPIVPEKTGMTYPLYPQPK